MFGTYSSGMHPSVCVEAVEKLGVRCARGKEVTSADNVALYISSAGDYFRAKAK